MKLIPTLIATGLALATQLAQATSAAQLQHAAKSTITLIQTHLPAGTGLRAQPEWLGRPHAVAQPRRSDTARLGSHLLDSYTWAAHIPLNNQTKVAEDANDHSLVIGGHVVSLGVGMAAGGPTKRCRSSAWPTVAPVDARQRCDD